ncbi:pyruvate kinase 1, cytosolic-like [Impatiens glandulifera]|uniref:pyruvate kinase 1, cytosolic-like n=1 Tax=Impatiens glandulifera TaxID=253017 RepID=UPI001FB0E129|nr:pyruvate kinase 1, cytosolic-like [Impatiens glandulifera]
MRLLAVSISGYYLRYSRCRIAGCRSQFLFRRRMLIKVVLTPDKGQETSSSSELLPINFPGLAKSMKKEEETPSLFTGSEKSTSGHFIHVFVDHLQIEWCGLAAASSCSLLSFYSGRWMFQFLLPETQSILSFTGGSASSQVISTWEVKNKIDFISLSYTRHAEDVHEARDFLAKLGDLSQTQIFAKIENVEGLTHFDEILKEADGIILSRCNLGVELPPEKAFLFQKAALYMCNMAGKTAVVVDGMDVVKAIEIVG